MKRVKEGGPTSSWWAVIRCTGVGVGRLRIISSGHEQMDDDVMRHLVGRGTCSKQWLRKGRVIFVMGGVFPEQVGDGYKDVVLAIAARTDSTEWDLQDALMKLEDRHSGLVGSYLVQPNWTLTNDSQDTDIRLNDVG